MKPEASRRSVSTPAAAGFSLVEVMLALGLTTFCLIALLGLLPAGLQTMKETQERAAAAACLEKIAAAIRNTSPSGGKYTAPGGWSSLSWSIGGPPVTATFTNISITGDPVTTMADQRLVARVRIVPPGNALSSGGAQVSVAWPNRATWEAGTSTWSHALGSLSTWVVFTPAQ